MGVVIYITFIIASLLILYKIIETAVRNGIDNSRIGQLLEKKHGQEQPGKYENSWLDDDLDN